MFWQFNEHRACFVHAEITSKKYVALSHKVYNDKTIYKVYAIDFVTLILSKKSILTYDTYH